MKTRADLFSKLNNGQKKERMEVKESKFAIKFLQILQEEGYINHWHKKENCEKGQPKIKVELKKRKQLSDGKERGWKILQLSKKSQPKYIQADSLWKAEGGLSIWIISTSRGLMTDRTARKYRLGGELICKIS